MVEGTTKEAAVEWCRRHLEATRAHAQEVLHWTPPQFEETVPENAVLGR